MILLDASNISGGGGSVLLEYLISEFQKRNLNYFLIRDIRNKKLSKSKNEIECKNFLHREVLINLIVKKNKISTIFCFGNYPPIYNRRIKTYIYMHSPFLVKSDVNIKFKIKQFFLKTILFKDYTYIFQTKFIRDSFINLYKFKGSSLILPFYDKEKIVKEEKILNKEKKSFIYNTFPYPHKNFKRLLESWKEIEDKNYNIKLYLTIPFGSYLDKEIESFKSVVNLGTLSFSELLKYTSQCEFCIYPSLNETLGLGLIEAAICNCKIISSDIDNINEVIIPSLKFNPLDNNSIIKSIQFAINEELLPSKLKIENKIDELINLFLSK